jgi:hypothetical protein
VVLHRRVLGQDRDALLTLQVVRVHHAVVDAFELVRGEGAGLLQHAVDDGGLAVVDVSDDGDVADVVARGHKKAYSRSVRNALRVHRWCAGPAGLNMPRPHPMVRVCCR